MDIVVILILMAVFYLVPELLKRRRPKTYEYPQIPDQVPPPETAPVPAAVKISQQITASFANESGLAAPPQPEFPSLEDKAAPSLADYSPWRVRLDQTAIVSGVIYAEILQPPRALRPLRPRGGRK
jgi:hypothetical protein